MSAKVYGAKGNAALDPVLGLERDIETFETLADLTPCIDCRRRWREAAQAYREKLDRLLAERRR